MDGTLNMRVLATLALAAGCISPAPDSTAKRAVEPIDTALPIVVGDSTDSTDSTDSVETGDTGGSDPSDNDAIYAAFYDPAVIQTVDLTIAPAVIAQLNAEAPGYLPADVTINGTLYPHVGIRLKGSSTYQDLDCSDTICKAGFKIKLNEFEFDQKLGDLERVTLNNMTTDYTQSKEIIAYNLLLEHSQLGSHCNFARVTLNGQAWGLYANIESADDHWLKRRFADATGEFWGTADYYGDFYTPYLDTGWVEKSGTGDMSEIIAVTAALDTYAGDFFGELGPVINVDQWLEYWSWCAAVGNYDGYPFTLNDVLIYADPADAGRLVFAPWGMDESWDEVTVSGRNWNAVGGRLGTACLADTACVIELKSRIREAVTAYESTDVISRAQAAWDLTEGDVLTDPRRPYTPDYVWYYRDYYASVMVNYPDYVRSQL
jgi:hypothetical protein